MQPGAPTFAGLSPPDRCRDTDNVNETLAFDRPFDFSYMHRAIGRITHRDGRGVIDCQCGRGVAGLSVAETEARWARHIAEAGA